MNRITIPPKMRVAPDAGANDVADGPVSVPNEAPRLFAENIRLTRTVHALRAEVERLRAALRDVLSYVPCGDMPVTIYDAASAALEEST